MEGRGQWKKCHTPLGLRGLVQGLDGDTGRWWGAGRLGCSVGSPEEAWAWEGSSQTSESDVLRLPNGGSPGSWKMGLKLERSRVREARGSGPGRRASEKWSGK